MSNDLVRNQRYIIYVMIKNDFYQDSIKCFQVLQIVLFIELVFTYLTKFSISKNCFWDEGFKNWSIFKVKMIYLMNDTALMGCFYVYWEYFFLQNRDFHFNFFVLFPL